MKNILKSLPLFLLVLLYTYAVASKLSDVNEFRGQLYNQSFPHALADILLFALPAAEILTVFFLLFPKTLVTGLKCSLGLLTVFTGYIILVKLHYWARIPCSCGGILSKMHWTTHLVFNLCFILINLLALRLEQPQKIPGKPKTANRVGTI